MSAKKRPLLRIRGGKFRAREYDRTVPDIIEYIVYLGVGGHTFSCSVADLFQAMKLKLRYARLYYEEFQELIAGCDGRYSFPWRIHASKDYVRVE